MWLILLFFPAALLHFTYFAWSLIGQSGQARDYKFYQSDPDKCKESFESSQILNILLHVVSVVIQLEVGVTLSVNRWDSHSDIDENVSSFRNLCINALWLVNLS